MARSKGIPTIAPTDRAARLKQEFFGSELTAEEVAFILEFDVITVNRHLREGKLRGYKRGRHWRIPEQSLLDFVTRSRLDREKESSNEGGPPF